MKLLAPHFEFYTGQKEEHALLAQIFAAEGISYIPWDAREEKLPSTDAIFWQGVSSYHQRVKQFNTLLSHAEKLKIPSFNSIQTIRWNTQKTYLQELEEKGILNIQTLWLKSFDSGTISNWKQKNNYQNLVIKPVISAGAHLTFCMKAEDKSAINNIAKIYTEAPKQALMVQPFAPEIINEGEWSFIFFGEELSHTVLKTAKEGDYRIQHVHGGSYHAVEPSVAMIAQARKVLEALPEPTAYARVDGIMRKGQLLLMEVELIEPYFYLDTAPLRAPLLAKTLKKQLLQHKQVA